MHDDIVWNSRIYVESEVSYCIRQQLEQVPDSANDKNEVLRLVSNFKGSEEIKKMALNMSGVQQLTRCQQGLRVNRI